MNQKQLNQQGEKYIAGLAQTARQIWHKMMEDLGLPADSKFVVDDLLQTSKYHKFYNKALDMYFEVWREYAAGGYVGLKINIRRCL